jgi:hypothetical protein
VRRAALAIAVVLGLLPGTAWTAASSPPVGGTETCGWRVSRDYGPQSLTYRLHLDVGGCAWWDGSERSLQVTVTRGRGHDAQRARSVPVRCIRGAAGCDASATLDHPEGETAHYAGQATWQWNDGRHRVAFATSCTTTSENVSCADDSARYGSAGNMANPGWKMSSRPL